MILILFILSNLYFSLHLKINFYNEVIKKVKFLISPANKYETINKNNINKNMLNNIVQNTFPFDYREMVSEVEDERLLNKKRNFSIQKREYYDNSSFETSIYNVTVSNPKNGICSSIKKIEDQIIKLTPENSHSDIDDDNSQANKKLLLNFSSKKNSTYGNYIDQKFIFQNEDQLNVNNADMKIGMFVNQKSKF